MSKLRIEDKKFPQVYSIEGNLKIRFSRTEIKKPVGKKKKWVYRPDNKNGSL